MPGLNPFSMTTPENTPTKRPIMTFCDHTAMASVIIIGRIEINP